MRRVRVALALLTAGCLSIVFAGRVGATPVGPGETVAIDNTGFVAPTGDLVDSGTQTVTLSFINPTVPVPTNVDVTFNTQVLRDPATQQLTFVYDFDEGATPLPALLDVQQALQLAAFTGFTTDVTSDTAINVTRAADGSTLDATASSTDTIQLPLIAIATDATEFDSNGSASGSFDGNAGTVELPSPVTATFSLSGLFQPVAAGEPPPPPPPNGIPLPAGVWFGLVALAGGGIAKRFRRTLRLA